MFSKQRPPQQPFTLTSLAPFLLPVALLLMTGELVEAIYDRILPASPGYTLVLLSGSAAALFALLLIFSAAERFAASRLLARWPVHAVEPSAVPLLRKVYVRVCFCLGLCFILLSSLSATADLWPTMYQVPAAALLFGIRVALPATRAVTRLLASTLSLCVTALALLLILRAGLTEVEAAALSMGGLLRLMVLSGGALVLSATCARLYRALKEPAFHL